MKKNPYLVNILLTAELSVICAAMLLTQSIFPAAVLPRVSVPTLVLLTLLPLIAAHYLAPGFRQQLLPASLLAGLTYALLPLCVGWDTGLPVWLLFLAGGVVFGVTSQLYGSIRQRMASGPQSRLSPIVHALGLYLASQCLQGLL